MAKVEQESSKEPVPAESSPNYDLSKPDDLLQMFKDKLPDAEIKSTVVAFIQTLAVKHMVSDYKINAFCFS